MAIATVSGAEGGSVANLLKRQALQVGQFGCDVRHHVPRGDEAFGQVEPAYICEGEGVEDGGYGTKKATYWGMLGESYPGESRRWRQAHCRGLPPGGE